MTAHRSMTRNDWLAVVGAALLATLFGSPSAPAAAEAARHGWSKDESYILMSAGEDGRMMMHGSTSDLRHAQALRTGSDPLLYVRRDGKAYVVRDPAILRQAQAIFAPQQALGRRQAALGSRQAALGSRQAALGGQQAELSSRQRSAGSRSDDLSRQQAELGRQQAELGEQQAALGAQQGRLGKEQERLGREAQARFRALVDDAQRRGLAREVS